MTTSRILSCAAITATLFAASATAQSILRVPSQFPTIDAAITAAVSGDTIYVDPGTYLESGLNFGNKQIVLRSVAGPAVTTIDGAGAGTILTVGAGNAPGTRVQGLTFTGGSSSGGGAIQLNPVFGGVTTLEVVDCVFDSNASPSGSGAGISQADGTELVVRGCVFRNNVAMSGGGAGISVSGAGFPTSITPLATIEGCQFLDNSTPSGGGAGVSIRNQAIVTVRSCLFAGNSATSGSGSAIRAEGGFPIGGSAPIPVVTIENCTVTDNDQIAVSLQDGADVTMRDTVVWGNNNATQLSGGSLVIVGFPPTLLDVSFCDLEGGAPAATPEFVVTAANNFDNDPLFVAPGSGDYRISAASPLIDAAGPGTTVLGRDAYGDPRNVNGDFVPGAARDVGADEFARFAIETSDRAPLPATTFTITPVVQPGNVYIAGTLFISPGLNELLLPALGQFQLDLGLVLTFDLGAPTVLPNPGGAFGLPVHLQAFGAVLDSGSSNITVAFSNTLEIVLQ